MITITTSNSSNVKPLNLLVCMSALPLAVCRYRGIATGPSSGAVVLDGVVKVDVVVVVLTVDPVEVVAAPTGVPETQKDALPFTPKLIAAVPDWWAPTSGALCVSLKFAKRCPLPKPGLNGESW